MSAEELNNDPEISPLLPRSRATDQPVAAGMILGSELRQARLRRKLTMKSVAAHVGLSISKISRLECAESPPRDDDIRRLVAAYDITDPRHIAELLELTREANTAGWWHKYNDVMSGWLKRLVGLEGAAVELRTYEVQVIPGLLQTRDYAEAVVKLGLPTATDAEVKRRVDLRMQRQENAFSAGSPRVRALLDEGLLLRPIGGPAVMAAQLRHLREVSAEEWINIRIVGFGQSARLPLPPSVTYLRFRPGHLSELVYLEHADNAQYLSGPEDVAHHRHLLDEAEGIAWSRAQSLDLLDGAIDRLSP